MQDFRRDAVSFSLVLRYGWNYGKFFGVILISARIDNSKNP